MAVKGIQLAVAATATRLSQPENDANTGNSVIFTNPTPKNLYVGGSGVTNSTGGNPGALVPAGSVMSFDLTQSDDILYGCVDTADAGAVFHILVTGV